MAEIRKAIRVCPVCNKFLSEGQSIHSKCIQQIRESVLDKYKNESGSRYLGMSRGRRYEIDTLGTVDPNYLPYRQDLLKILTEEDLQIVEQIGKGVQFAGEKEVKRKATIRKIHANREKFIDVIRRHTIEEDAVNPRKSFLKELRMEVAITLGLTMDNWDQVKVYTAVKSPLDIIGIDSFIVWEGNPRVVTLDATLREEKVKEGEGGADIIFGQIVHPELAGNDVDREVLEKEYESTIQQIAKQVVAIWQSAPDEQRVGI